MVSRSGLGRGVGRKARVEWREEMSLVRDWGMLVVCLSGQLCYDDAFLLEMVGYKFMIRRTSWVLVFELRERKVACLVRLRNVFLNLCMAFCLGSREGECCMVIMAL